MTDRLKVYFDPRCPWCYQTILWAWRLETFGNKIWMSETDARNW